MSRQNVAILGSTGSVGISTLEVIRHNPSKFRAFALVANTNFEKMFEQCVEFKPEVACLASEDAAKALADKLENNRINCTVLTGLRSIEDIVRSKSVDSIMAAIVGSAGLRSTLEAAKAGKKIMLANKESLVMAGDLLTKLVQENKGLLLPIDSEHNAIFQVLPSTYKRDPKRYGIKKIILTASGGPFLHFHKNKLKTVNPMDACEHPTWKMGKKISVDSATMMNKGLEVIEASYLFNLSSEQIEVLIHPESIIHSLVEYIDGSTLAQLGTPDMKTPISYSLGFPERIKSFSPSLSLSEIGKLSFLEPDLDKFPCLALAYQALNSGGRSLIYLNAANEVAVGEFLNHSLDFTSISTIVEKVLNHLPNAPIENLDDILEADKMARNSAFELI